jgi:ATP-dependent exoDNAse (exonuclease V) alpha subunit
MLQRNLLYTGQTRGKRLVVLVGHRRLLNQGMILIGPCAPSL